MRNEAFYCNAPLGDEGPCCVDDGYSCNIHDFMDEPMYDDEQLELFKEQERNESIGDLWHYILALEDYVIHLRCRINHLHGSSKNHFQIQPPTLS